MSAEYVAAVAEIDVVIVSYNSSGELRRCVEPITRIDGATAIVVDNASADGSLETIADLPALAIALRTNGGFAHGCNVGWRAGSAPFVLLLNPDAVIEARALELLVSRLEEDPSLGAVAPLVVGVDGVRENSLRRFPRLRSTYAQALFLHRVFPGASWSDEVVRNDAAYCRAGTVEWASGACILVRRSILEHVGGLDERFFHYCEDIDLCLRIRAAGFAVGFEPDARVVHEGGASAPRAELLPLLAMSRIRLSRKHDNPVVAYAQRAGIALGALTHALLSRHGRRFRAGHARSLCAATLGRSPSHLSRSPEMESGRTLVGSGPPLQ